MIGPITVRTAAAMRALGAALATHLRAGDLVLLGGDLGAGKTTLAAGIGAGLRVRGAVTSPTFVIAREHPPRGAGPGLVHVDAYRLGGIDELEDLDLTTNLDSAVLLVEWGHDLAERLAQDRLEIRITRGTGAARDRETAEHRAVQAHPIGRRWDAVRLRGIMANAVDDGSLPR